MLHEFLASHRNELIARCREKVAARFVPARAPALIDHGVPVFLEQLGDTLSQEFSTPGCNADETGSSPMPSEIGRAAALHGAELLRRGFTVEQVVREYGDVCQAVTELAVEVDEPISTNEFRTLNRCLDGAIADAVAAFGRGRELAFNDQAANLHTRLDSFSDEFRRLLDVAVQAFSAIKTGNVGSTGATGSLLGHTLTELRYLVDRALPEIHGLSTSAIPSEG